MSIKNVAVFIDAEEPSEERLKVGLTMAQKYDAHLTGIFVLQSTMLPDRVVQLLPSSTQRVIEEAAKGLAKKAEAFFREQMKQAGREANSDWAVIEGTPNRVAAIASRYSDLIIIGQPENPSTDTDPSPDPGEVVVTCGRPLLVIPRNYKFRSLTENAVFGWNGSREAARTLADAMMMLETKTLVTVATIGTNMKSEFDHPFSIETHLNRHGIATKSVKLPLKHDNPGLELLKLAEESRADLLIMGAYSSRSRLREQIMGGTTRSVLNHMSLPVLLSH